MKTYFLPLIVLLFSCTQSERTDKDESLDTANDTAQKQVTTPAVKKTFLEDSSAYSGNCIIFLRPDKSRLKSYSDVQKEIIKQIDSEFGVSISATRSTMKLFKKYVDIDDNDMIIEPSAGSGVFIPYIKRISKNYAFYDIKPEHPEIIKHNFLINN